MLQRCILPYGVVFYRSPLLHAAGVPHAFSTRLGGSSPPPFDSMNMGNPNGALIADDDSRIWSHYELLQSGIGCGGRILCRVHQVHGAAIVQVRAGEPFDVSQKADALLSDDPARVISVRVADCVPILLATSTGQVVAAVHAGWRGVIAGIVPAAAQVLRNRSRTSNSRLLAAIGPCIGVDAFEVGPTVLSEFDRVFGHRLTWRRGLDGKGHVDLREAVRIQLLEAGLGENDIDTTDRCTHRDAGEFFSHRRENGLTGRMAAIIGARGAAHARALNG